MEIKVNSCLGDGVSNENGFVVSMCPFYCDEAGCCGHPDTQCMEVDDFKHENGNVPAFCPLLKDNVVLKLDELTKAKE